MRVTLVGCLPPLEVELRRRLLAWRESTRVEARAWDLPLKDTQVVLLGPAVPSPLVVAQRVHRESPSSEIVLAPPSEKVASLSESLKTIPYVPASIAVVAANETARVVTTIGSACLRAQARASLDRNLRALDAQLSTPPMASVPKETLDQLRARMKLLSSIVESSGDAILSKKLDGTITSWNDGAARLYGYQAEEIVGRSVETIVPLDRLDEVHDIHARIREGKRVPPFETERVRADGMRVTVSLTVSPIFDALDRVIGASAIARDVSETKRLVMALEERTCDLERSNRDLEQFAYVASHDLREPLRMVSAYTELLSDRYGDLLDERGHRYLGFALDGATRMKQLIGDLLEYSKVGHDQERSRVDLTEVVALARDNLQIAIEESGARIEHGELPFVVGDRTQLVQLFQNLIDNAIKFRGAERPMVRIGARREDDDFCRVTVADDGIGIEERFAERVFVIFQRLGGREAPAGSGIGLSVAKKIVEGHGGRIWVESELGCGTTFNFTLRYASSVGEAS